MREIATSSLPAPFGGPAEACRRRISCGISCGIGCHLPRRPIPCWRAGVARWVPSRAVSGGVGVAWAVACGVTQPGFSPTPSPFCFCPSPCHPAFTPLSSPWQRVPTRIRMCVLHPSPSGTVSSGRRLGSVEGLGVPKPPASQRMFAWHKGCLHWSGRRFGLSLWSSSYGAFRNLYVSYPDSVLPSQAGIVGRGRQGGANAKSGFMWLGRQ